MRRGIARLVGSLAVGAVLAGSDLTFAQQPGGTPARPPASAPASRRPGAQVVAPGGGQTVANQAAAKIPQPPPPDPRRMDAVLSEWALRTRNNQSLYAKFIRTDIVQAWQDRTEFAGIAVLKNPNLAYLDFKKVGEGGTTQPYERIVVTPDYVYQFDSTKQQVHIYQMARDAQQRAMDEGPLPFLFNMDVDRARERYAMTLARESEQHYLVAIEPRQQADKEAFGKAYIWLNKSSYLPDQIILVDPNNGKDTKTYKISEIKMNVELQDNWFDGKAQAEQVAKAKWDLVYYSPEGEPVREQINSSPNPARVGGAPAPGPVAPRR